MRNRLKHLRALASRRCAAAGIDWKELNSQAEQIILFGSYAVSANRKGSDLDLLCIGEGTRYKNPVLHIIWVPKSHLASRNWLGSELATHVARYGKWLKGHNTWAFQRSPNSRSLSRKRRLINSRLVAMDRYWASLLPVFQNQQLTKLRRDIQRYEMMCNGEPPAPKSELDATWGLESECGSWERLLASNLDVARKVTKFLKTHSLTDKTLKHVC